MLGYRWPSTGVKSLLPGKLRKKSEKGLPGALGPRVNTPPKKVKNESKTSQKPEKNLKNSHFRLFFEPFLTLGPRGPGNPFSDFFWSFPGKGLLTPVDGQRYAKSRASQIAFDLGFRIEYLYSVGQSCWLLKWWWKHTTTLRQRHCVEMWFGSLLTITLRQNVCLKLFLIYVLRPSKHDIHKRKPGESNFRLNFHVIHCASRKYTWKAGSWCVSIGAGHYIKTSGEII